MSTKAAKSRRERSAGSGYEWIGGFREGALYLGCTERQLRRWVQAGRVEHNRMAGAVRFSKEGLDRFVEDSTVGGAA